MAFENVLNLDSIALTEVGSGEYCSRVGELADVLKTAHLGFHLHILEPHNFSCPYHWHHAEEELFLVLKGEATLRQNGEFRHVGPGDLIFSGLGAEYAHQFYNHTDEPFRFLALSNRERWDVCEYPDSKKLKVRGLQKVFEVETEVEYQRGETQPRDFWPADVLAGKIRQSSSSPESAE